jgi:hypothetical protein
VTDDIFNAGGRGVVELEGLQAHQILIENMMRRHGAQANRPPGGVSNARDRDATDVRQVSRRRQRLAGRELDDLVVVADAGRFGIEDHGAHVR